jgi:hypothetical protein
VELASLDDAVDGYAEIGQPRWASWRRKLQLTQTLPEHFGRALESLTDFANPVITGGVERLCEGALSAEEAARPILDKLGLGDDIAGDPPAHPPPRRRRHLGIPREQGK